jgi:hypothetical protein
MDRKAFGELVSIDYKDIAPCHINLNAPLEMLIKIRE